MVGENSQEGVASAFKRRQGAVADEKSVQFLLVKKKEKLEFLFALSRHLHEPTCRIWPRRQCSSELGGIARLGFICVANPFFDLGLG